MASLLGDRNTADRDALIGTVASVAQSFLAPEMLRKRGVCRSCAQPSVMSAIGT